ncbi:Glyoxalase/Bleomycin resistance protein/Dioxygenase superfamily [Croceitalea dokdonensis DOKDO 023]|uniref:Glyoxalase/Bleomycin resistance protein/Dioxygenase superfamily n=1 Tax=Croceitalea dokdonensis DOKDO 023 TaxID=1300341 RepID=A0A0P7AFG8_9FLAO|nr:VOC family protein [Croceitalea dokdonensis]KPM32059.1 Glyoxalase/Bleomycin resistance protein/Dioxygenase superfamily [Croceitalea dokdonensis DOKDO 023]
MIKSLDHFVHLVLNLDKAREHYIKLGFNVRPASQHLELGSSNCVIQFPKTYYELVDLSEGEKWLSDPYLNRFKLGEGLAHVSLDSENLVSDRARLIELGYEPEPIVSARRKITMPDGAVDETDSDCFYVWRKDNPYLSLFTSIHNKPETIFIPEFRQHPNKAIALKELVFITTRLEEDIVYFTDQYGKSPDEISNEGFSLVGRRGDVAKVMTPSVFAKEYGDIAHSELGPLSGIPKVVVFKSHDLSKTQQYFENSGIPFKKLASSIAVHEDNGMGAAMIFT